MEQPDRKNPPLKSDISVIIPGEPEKFILDNDVPVFIHNTGTEEITRIEFWFRAGSYSEPVPVAASTANMMLFEGTSSLTAEQLAERLDYYGTHPQQYCDRDSAGISILFLNKHAENVLPVCHEILFEPSFPEREFSQLIKKRIQWFNVNRQKVSTLASERFNELLFGAEHPYGRSLKKEYLKNITISDVSDFHRKNYLPSNMAVFVSGKIDDKILSLLRKHFGTIVKGEKPIQISNSLAAYTGGIRDHIPRKGSVQAAIKIGNRSITKTHKDYCGLKVVDTLLGGYFGSRLMSNLREDKGYTYGIHSSLSSLSLSGQAVISAEVGAGYTEDAVNEILKEIEILRTEKVSADELRIVKNYMLGELVRMFDGPFSVSESYRSAWEFGLNTSYYSELAKKVREITPDEILLLAQTYYKPDEFVSVTSGP